MRAADGSLRCILYYMPFFSCNALRERSALSNYTILRVLGEGEFSITYLAYDNELKTEVVIKENMPAALARRYKGDLYVHPDMMTEFKRAEDCFIKEAQALTKINHSNIVRVTRVFKTPATAYYVMPYVGGKSLEQLLAKEGPMPENRLRPILEAMLDSLHCLHGEGLLHRDIKPANILLDKEGKPILIDFGVAQQPGQNSHTVPESPGYTPFEQMQTDGNIGPWSDLYALGGTMYKLITGRTPVHCKNRVERDLLTRLTDSWELCMRYSCSFLSGIDKALAFGPEERWQSAAEWQQALSDNSEPTKLHSPTLIIPAASNGQEAAVRILLDEGANIEVSDDYGNTPLILAARHGHEAVVRLLLEKGANIEAKDKYGSSPLISAACMGRKAVVGTLLEMGANTEAENNHGRTAYDCAKNNTIKQLICFHQR